MFMRKFDENQYESLTINVQLLEYFSLKYWWVELGGAVRMLCHSPNTKFLVKINLKYLQILIKIAKALKSTAQHLKILLLRNF